MKCTREELIIGNIENYLNSLYDILLFIYLLTVPRSNFDQGFEDKNHNSEKTIYPV